MYRLRNTENHVGKDLAMKRRIRFVLAAGIMAALFLGFTAHAEEQEGDEDGFPAYSVARLKIFEGSVWVRTPDSGDWQEFLTNSPIPDRSLVSVPEGSEAELQFHGGQYVLLTGGTELDVRRLSEDRSAFRLRAGEIRFDLPAEDFAPVRVLVPAGSKVDFPGPGRYWLTVRGGGSTRLVVRRGEGNVSGERGNFTVREGEVATIGNEVRISRYTGPDDDRYAAPPPLAGPEREVALPPAAVYELRDYGEWVTLPTYGYVWRPRVVAGWRPYFYGRWAWVSPYGWTWVSYEPWGWYPYRCGYWFSDPTFGWVWSPYQTFVSVNFVFGSFTHFHRHVNFFPSTVRFVRDGGQVRWVPLRPGERFIRPTFTRVDNRLVRWERPLARGAVFVRREGSKGQEWRDWSSVRREVRAGAGASAERNIRAAVPTTEQGARREVAKPPSRGGGNERRGPKRDGVPQREFRGKGAAPAERNPAVTEPRKQERVQGQERKQDRYEREVQTAPRGNTPPVRTMDRGTEATGTRERAVQTRPSREEAVRGDKPERPPARVESGEERRVPPGNGGRAVQEAPRDRGGDREGSRRDEGRGGGDVSGRGERETGRGTR